MNLSKYIVGWFESRLEENDGKYSIVVTIYVRKDAE